MLSLLKFFNEESIEIYINPARLSEDAGEDVMLKTYILLLCVYFGGSASGGQKAINRNYLKVLLFLCVNPEDFENVCERKGSERRTFFEQPKRIHDINRCWDYFENVFSFLKVVGFFKDQSERVILLTPIGQKYFEEKILNNSNDELFEKQKNIIAQFKEMRLTLRDLNIV